MHNAYIGIGTNIEPRLVRMLEAFDSLITLGNPKAKSHIFETKPVGYEEQSNFLNAVVHLNTQLSATDLHVALKKLELELGRKERERWHEREIDFDLLFFDDEVINTDALTIPHPELHNRGFVLVPLAEIAPGLIHPMLHRTIAELLHDFETTQGDIHVYSNPD